MEIKTYLGFISVIVGVIAYIPYLIDVVKRSTRPHAYSWLTWTLLSLIAFSVQITNDAGPGSWLMAFTAAASFVIFLLSLKYGEKNVTKTDKITLLVACIAILTWFVSKQPLYSVILITFADALGGFLPTFRKSYDRPEEETASIYFLYVISIGLSLVAFTELNLINALYPATLLFLNFSLGTFLLSRRAALKRA